MKEFLKSLEQEAFLAAQEAAVSTSAPVLKSSPTKKLSANISLQAKHKILQPLDDFENFSIPSSRIAEQISDERPTTIKIRKIKLKEIPVDGDVCNKTTDTCIATSSNSTIETYTQNQTANTKIQVVSTVNAPSAAIANLKTSRKSRPATLLKPIKSLQKPSTLDNMIKRQKEREERKATVEARRKEREEQIRAEKEAMEHAKRLLDEAEKKKFLEAKAEERRIAKMEEETKIAEKAKLVENIRKASNHAKKQAMKTFGMRPWKILIVCCRQDELIADQFRGKWNVCGFLMTWQRKLNEKRKAIELYADSLANKKLVLKIWNFLCLKYDFVNTRTINAENLYHRNLKIGIFSDWRNTLKFAILGRLQREREKELKADLLAKKLVPRRFISRWKENVTNIKQERWREWRRQQLRDRIKEILVCSSFDEKLKIEYAPSAAVGRRWDPDI
ncbi:hypothetical protein HK100_002210 [Physocladia obscura]|uniref:Uncharacterized protein n=1 Tax=Physocladia obscura TaxID=109957 RepID=A0AAD5XFL1_9FUNG|nr:hypothetical protein HK100_002210 [Physocladia obscura]